MDGSECMTDKRMKTVVGTVLLLWLALAVILGAGNAFVRAAGAAW